MNITSETRIGELVAQDYRTALVFKKHKIEILKQEPQQAFPELFFKK